MHCPRPQNAHVALTQVLPAFVTVAPAGGRYASWFGVPLMPTPFTIPYVLWHVNVCSTSAIVVTAGSLEVIAVGPICCSRRAAIPDTCGAAKDVPEPRELPDGGFVMSGAGMFTPGANAVTQPP